jgi:hypothetical protein
MEGGETRSNTKMSHRWIGQGSQRLIIPSASPRLLTSAFFFIRPE